MSLFRDLGRRVERFKRDASAASGSTAYECAGCGRRLHADHDRCPDCGSDEVGERD